jgi:hypothetical protein
MRRRMADYLALVRLLGRIDHRARGVCRASSSHGGEITVMLASGGYLEVDACTWAHQLARDGLAL